MSEELVVRVVHQDVIAEESINVNDLPAEIKNKIKAFNLQMGRFKSKPTEQAVAALEQKSLSIADDIQTWLERDLEDEETPPAPNPPAPKPKNKEQDEDEDEDDDEEDEEEDEDDDDEEPAPLRKPALQAPPRPVNKDAQIIRILQANGGEIDIDELTNILGKEPDYPEHKVGNVVIRKVYLRSVYRIK